MLRLSILICALLAAGCQGVPSERKTVELDLPPVEYSK